MAFPVKGGSVLGRNFLFTLSRTAQFAFRSTQEFASLSTASPSTTNRRRYRLNLDLRGLVLLSKLIAFGGSRPNGHHSFLDRIRTCRLFAPAVSRLSFSDHRPSQPNRKYSSSGDEPRGFGNGRNEGGGRPLKLMDYEELLWPSPWKSLRNYVFSALIRGYYDHTFTLGSFLKGAEQAVAVVSGLISNGDFESLDGLVSNEAIWELRRNYDLLTSKQRQFVAVDVSDIFFRFVYEIGMIFDDDTNQRFVEITTVFQGFQGLEELKRRNANFAEDMFRERELLYVCNYRFIREFTKGKEDEWIVNKLNHYCLIDRNRVEGE